MNNYKLSLSVFLSIPFLACLSSCSNKADTTAKDPVKEYQVLQLSARKAETFADYPAAIQGIQNIEIRPKIDGYVESIYVDEGSAVKKGQLLFHITAPQYEQNVKQKRQISRLQLPMWMQQKWMSTRSNRWWIRIL